MSDTVAFAEGRAAYADGYADDLNPYQRGTQLYEDWLMGWDYAYEEDWRGREMDEKDNVLDDPRRGQARGINRS